MSGATALEPRRGRGWLRALRWLLALALVAVLVLAVVAVPLTVLPETVAVPSEPDAVIVLSGGSGSGERLDTALALMERQVGPPADLLLISRPPVSDDQRLVELCGTATQAYAIACFAPDADDTAAEAREIGALAGDQGWERIAVVTSTYHATRARQRLERCLDADIEMVAASPDLSPLERVLASLRELAALAGDALGSGEC